MKSYTPPIEVFEKEDKFMVKTEFSGMKKESMDISVEGNTLTVKGSKYGN
ncbi:Hsp20 family protein [Chloroflexota bacterium]